MDLKVQWDVLAAWIHAQFKQEQGASVVEYALLAALVALACVAAGWPLGSWASTTFGTFGSALSGSGS
jgi:Flp pilus assembly pilin Flp